MPRNWASALLLFVHRNCVGAGVGAAPCSRTVWSSCSTASVSSSGWGWGAEYAQFSKPAKRMAAINAVRIVKISTSTFQIWCARTKLPVAIVECMCPAFIAELVHNQNITWHCTVSEHAHVGVNTSAIIAFLYIRELLFAFNTRTPVIFRIMQNTCRRSV